jgi:hypothetical protein
MKDRILLAGKISMTDDQARCMARHDVVQARLGATCVSGVLGYKIVLDLQGASMHN